MGSGAGAGGVRALRVAVVGGGRRGRAARRRWRRAGWRRSCWSGAPGGEAVRRRHPPGHARRVRIPLLVDRRVTRMRLLSPSNLASDFSRHLRPAAHIAMLRREVLDSFLRSRAQSQGARLLPALLTSLSLPSSRSTPTSSTTSPPAPAPAPVRPPPPSPSTSSSAPTGPTAASRAASARGTTPPPSPSRSASASRPRAWPPTPTSPRCTSATTCPGLLRLGLPQAAARARAAPKLAGGVVVRVEAHPIPEHPRPRRVAGRAALVGDAAGYVARCSGEGIYFAAKSGRMCGDAIVRIWKEKGRVAEADLKREYLRRWDEEFAGTFRFLDALQRVFYGSNAAREALVELCGDEYVQRMTFDSYLHKKMAAGRPLDDLGLLWKSAGSLLRATILGREVERLRRSTL
uniref:Geranylgeranyl diphosphate reductase, chloroplastic n=1 Tax=Ananas comosus var. bracteatus TaxID=296719 RepID=A0A6V7QA57_ANACO|nr:unnamed protein product [Ananas comosus var. bracteatus]